MAEYWHITWVTHNSRISQRMIDYKAKRNEGIRLDENAEIMITKIISDIVNKYQFKIFAYNICQDHIHMIIESDLHRLSDTVKILKGLSAVNYKDIIGIHRKESYHLWAQKYNKWRIETDVQFRNTMSYIICNRQKHMLSENKGLKPLVLL